MATNGTEELNLGQGKEVDDGLTEQERAALLLDDGDDGGAESGADAGKVAKDKPVEVADPAVAAKPEDKAVDPVDTSAAPAPAEAKAADAPLAAPVLLVDAPVDVEVRLKAIEMRKDELIKAFDDGEITAREYQQRLDIVAKEERVVEREVDRAKLAAELEDQRQHNDWSATVNRFVSDKDYSSNPRLYRALDQEVRDVAGTDEGKMMSGQQILDKAHANLVEAGMVKGTAAKAGDKADDKGDPVVKTTIPKPELPPNLAKVPAAAGTDTGDGRFASLDRLFTSNPLAYEEQLMKMPESERNAYLATS